MTAIVWAAGSVDMPDVPSVGGSALDVAGDAPTSVDLDALRYAAVYGQAAEDEAPLFLAAADEIDRLRAAAALPDTTRRGAALQSTDELTEVGRIVQRGFREGSPLSLTADLLRFIAEREGRFDERTVAVRTLMEARDAARADWRRVVGPPDSTEIYDENQARHFLGMAGWLRHRADKIAAGNEPDWPDAMQVAAVGVSVPATPEGA